jgi:hypothetical protein
MNSNMNLAWVKATASNPNGCCAELAGGWVKASASGGNGGQCVELAPGSENDQRVVCMRNSRDPAGPMLVFTPDEMRCLRAGFRAGEFDYLLD